MVPRDLVLWLGKLNSNTVIGETAHQGLNPLQIFPQEPCLGRKTPNAPRYAPLVHRYLIKPSPFLQINPNHQFSELSAPVTGPGFTTQKAHPALPISQDIQT